MKLILSTILLFWAAFQCSAQECEKNPDDLYNRETVLQELAKTLNESIPEYRTIYSEFRVEKQRAVLFFVHDLTDPANKQTNSRECVNFINNHVYHVSPLSYMYSFSHIVVLENGKLKIFKSLNCLVDKLEDVVKYLNTKLVGDKNKDVIIERVKNYRKFGKYYRTCDRQYHKCWDDDFEEININGLFEYDSENHLLLFLKYGVV
jgi:hypothetical protein